jgi:hypothetical protein
MSWFQAGSKFEIVSRGLPTVSCVAFSGRNARRGDSEKAFGSAVADTRRDTTLARHHACLLSCKARKISCTVSFESYLDLTLQAEP